MRRSGGVLLMVLLGCSGGTPPAAETPESEGPLEATPEQAESGETGDPEPGAEAEAQAADQPATPEDLQSVLQLLLDDPALEQYLHLEKSGRVPLKISGVELPDDKKLIKASHHVSIVAEAKPKEAVIVFTSVEVSGDHARLKYRYDVEGIRGSASMAKKSGTWELRSNRILEN